MGVIKKDFSIFCRTRNRPPSSPLITIYKEIINLSLDGELSPTGSCSNCYACMGAAYCIYLENYVEAFSSKPEGYGQGECGFHYWVYNHASTQLVHKHTYLEVDHETDSSQNMQQLLYRYISGNSTGSWENTSDIVALDDYLDEPWDGNYSYYSGGVCSTEEAITELTGIFADARNDCYYWAESLVTGGIRITGQAKQTGTSCP